MSIEVLTIKDNKVEGPISNMKFWTGAPTKHLRPPTVLYYTDTPLERKGEKIKWEVIPPDYPQQEIIHLDEKTKVFWVELTDWNNRPNVFFGVSLDGGKTWSCHRNYNEFHWQDRKTYELFRKRCDAIKEAFDADLIAKRKIEEKEKFKALAAEQGLTQSELRKKLSEDKKVERLHKKELRESRDEVFHMKKRLELGQHLRKMEANLEFLLGLSKQEENLDVSRFSQKIKSIKSISYDLDQIVKKFNNKNSTKKKS